MTDVVLPNGAVIEGVPEGIGRAELMRRLGKAGFDISGIMPSFGSPEVPAFANNFQGSITGPGPRQSVPSAPVQPVGASASEVIGRSATQSLLDNVLSAGQGLANRAMPDFAAQAVQMARGQPVDPFEAPPQVFNATAEGMFPSLLPQEMAEQHPIATQFGEGLGDAAMLLGVRLPVRGAMANASGQAMAQAAPLLRRANIQNLLRGAVQGAGAQAQAPGVMRLLNEYAQGLAKTKLPRGLARAAETGFEGAFLAALDEQDPLQTAALSAGAQVLGSGMLSLAAPFVSKKTVLPALALSAVGIQLFHELTPGGADNLVESGETAIVKMLPMVALGAGAALLGTSRLPKGWQDNLPKLADAITAIPRTQITSLIGELSAEEKRGDDTLQRVLTQYTMDPEYFGPEAARRLERSLLTEAGSPTETVNALLKIPEFRDKFEKIGTPQANASYGRRIVDAIGADNAGARSVSATQAAEALSRHIPKDSGHRRIYQNDGPRHFIEAVLSNPQDANVLNKLGGRQRQDVLETHLSQLVFKAVRDDDGRKLLDPGLLQERWQGLPEAVRAAYPKHVQQNVDRFIAEAQRSPVPITVLPPLAARSLMLPNGELSALLGGDE